MKKGLDALTQAVVTGAIVPTNEAQRKELSAEWQRTGSAETLAKLEAVEAKHTPGPIIVRVEGGLVQSVDAPKGVTVIVRDYDCECADEEDISGEDDSGRYVESEWDGEGEAQTMNADLLATLYAIVDLLNQPVQHTGSADATRILRQDARTARAFALSAIARAEGGAK